MDNIVVLHARFGEGHKKAASCICQFLDAECRDLLEFCCPLLRWFLSHGYIFITNYLPFLWRALYLFSRPKRAGVILRFFTRLIFRRFFEYIREKEPTVIITTHFFPISLIADLKNSISLYLVCVVTDFCAHPLWAHRQVDEYIVAHERTKTDLIAHGICTSRIHSGYVALREGFFHPLDERNSRQRFQLDDKPSLLWVSSQRGKFPLLKAVLQD